MLTEAQRTRCPHVVTLLGTACVREHLMIFLEHMPGGDLLDRVLDHGPLVEREAMRALGQLLEALQHLHGHGIAHGDIKPENLLCTAGPDEPVSIKLADFGAATCMLDFASGRPPFAPPLGTAAYSAPEILRGVRGFDPRHSDMWSVGVTSYVLLSGCFPYASEAELFSQGWEPRFAASGWTSVSLDARALVLARLRFQPAERASACDAAGLPCFVPSPPASKRASARKRARGGADAGDPAMSKRRPASGITPPQVPPTSRFPWISLGSPVRETPPSFFVAAH